jgi:hypothetical protein
MSNIETKKTMLYVSEQITMMLASVSQKNYTFRCFAKFSSVSQRKEIK